MTELHFDKKLSHAYILTSQSREIREREACRLAAAMICEESGERPCGECRHCRKALSGIHPDVITIEREPDSKGNKKRDLSVDRVRAVVADASIMPNEAEKKVYIILDAETMNTSAQNAMLKLLEEPPGGACFILCAENAAALLDTVRSRCAELSINASEAEGNREAAERAKEYLRLTEAGDKAGLVRMMSALEKLKHDEAEAFADETLRLIVHRFEDKNSGKSPEKLLELAGLMKKTRKYLQANVGIKHVFGLLAAKTI